MNDIRAVQAAQAFTGYHCPRYAELPGLPLYRDQVIDTLEQYASLFYAAGEPPVTPAMVNNYVKLRLIEPPVKKKYEREQMARLLLICLLKQVLSISELRRLMEIQTASYPFAQAYDYFCEELETALQATFGTRDFSAHGAVSHITTASELVRSAAFCFANKIFAVKYIELEALHQVDPLAQLEL